MAGPDVQDTTVLENALTAYPSDLMQTYEVSTLVNSARNNGPQVVEPAQPSETQETRRHHASLLTEHFRVANHPLHT